MMSGWERWQPRVDTWCSHKNCRNEIRSRDDGEIPDGRMFGGCTMARTTSTLFSATARWSAEGLDVGKEAKVEGVG